MCFLSLEGASHLMMVKYRTCEYFHLPLRDSTGFRPVSSVSDIILKAIIMRNEILFYLMKSQWNDQCQRKILIWLINLFKLLLNYKFYIINITYMNYMYYISYSNYYNSESVIPSFIWDITIWQQDQQTIIRH